MSKSSVKQSNKGKRVSGNARYTSGQNDWVVKAANNGQFLKPVGCPARVENRFSGMAKNIEEVEVVNIPGYKRRG